MGTTDVQIQAGRDESDPFSLAAEVDITAVVLPANWTSAPLGMKASLDGESWATVRSEDGLPWALALQPPFGALLSNAVMTRLPIAAGAQLTLTSGDIGTPVPQDDDVAITLLWRRAE